MTLPPWRIRGPRHGALAAEGRRSGGRWARVVEGVGGRVEGEDAIQPNLPHVLFRAGPAGLHEGLESSRQVSEADGGWMHAEVELRMR